MENQIWYDVSGTPTKLTGIKYGSFHYHADIGTSGKARLGGVCSSYIEFDYLLSNGVTFNVGDVLRYKQLFPEIDNAFEPAATDLTWDGGNFYVKSVDDDGKTCHIIAFDTVSKLDIDYSARLKATESGYPHSLLWLLNDVCTFAGVTYDLAIMGDLSGFSVNYFYATGITCRDIVRAIAELCCYYVRATENDNELKFTYGGGHSNSPWQNSYRYIVCPDDGTYRDINNNIAVNVWYKENGMSLAEELTDYDGTVVYNVNGTPYGDTTATNPYKFYSANSLFSSSLRSAPSTLYNYVRVAVSNIYNVSGSVMSGQIHLFPFRFPYKVGQYARIVAPDGSKYYFPIMAIDLSESEVVIEAYSDKTVGAEAQDGVGSGGEDRSLALDVRVTDLESKVDSIYPNYKIYDSVTSLGLTSGSATIAGAYSALAKDEMLVCPATEFSASEVPSTSGCMVEMAKRYTDGSSGRILFWGRTALIGDYRMFVGDSPFAPTGVWVSLEGQAGALPNNTDLNTVTTPGTYLIDGNNTYTNSPATYGTFECISHRNDRVYMQRITNLSRIYWRYATNTSTTPPQWGSWYYVAGTQV